MLGLRSRGSNAALVALLFVAGCPQVSPQSAGVPVAVGHPDLVCPAGTIATGTPPPIGIDVWCERIEPDGRTRVRQGPYLSWYRVTDATQEKRSSEGSYENGVQNGPWVTWYENGNPKSRGSYTLGVKEGLWTTFHPDGGQAAEGHYVQGLEQGSWQFWDAASSWRAAGEFVGGHRDGVWLEYGPAPDPIRERLYRNGELVTVREL